MEVKGEWIADGKTFTWVYNEYEEKIKEKIKMNNKFNKALFYLDKGKYEEGLDLLEN